MTSFVSQRRAIFVVGNSRSGTTLMGQILNRVEDVYTFEELHFFEELWDSSLEISSQDAVLIVARLLNIARDGYIAKTSLEPYMHEARVVTGNGDRDNWTAIEAYEKYIFYEAGKNNSNIPCEQTPRYCHFIDEIFEHFPNARIVNMVRDPRDVVHSQKNRWKIGKLGGVSTRKSNLLGWANYHPIISSMIWRSSVRASNRFEADPRVNNVNFESLINNPEFVLKDLLKNLDLNYSPGLLLVNSITSSFRPDGGLGIDSSRSNNWDKGGLSNTEIAWVERICGNDMIALGYEVSGSKFGILGFAISSITLPVKLLIAFCLNFSRAKNLFSLIKRII